jgi:hypothetical protein
VKALQKAYERAAAVTRKSIWSHAYIMHLISAEAAEFAAREYDSTRPAAWVKRRR